MKTELSYFIAAIMLAVSAFGPSGAHAATSLNDVLTAACIAPFCVNHSGSNAVISSDGTHLAVKDWGPYKKDEPTLLFIHGYPHGQGMWIDQVFSPLVLKYRLVTMDTRGGGGSDVAPAANYGAQNFADDIKAVISTLHLKNVILVAHSYGGIVVNSYVSTYGASQLKGIVLAAAVPSLPDIGSLLLPSTFAILLETINPTTYVSGTVDFTNIGHYQPFSPLLTNLFINMDFQVSLTGRQDLIGSAAANEVPTVFSIAAPLINVPVSIIQGVQDIVIPPTVSDFWQAHLTNSPRVSRVNIANSGHLTQLETTAQFNSALSNFVGSLHLDTD